MYPKLLHIYGPVWIRSYGVMIVLGFLTFLFLTYIHPMRKKLIKGEVYINTVFIGLLAAIIGGRFSFVVTNWSEMSANPVEAFFPWVGGFMVGGSIVGVIITVPLYLRWHGVKVLPLMDVVALYAPLMQAIARVGCFMSGCCYGSYASSALPWAVTFTNAESFAPLHVSLHPAQIYASLASLSIFLLIFCITKCMVCRPGQVTFFYLTLESIARFVVDFWRGDRGDLVSLVSGVNVSEPQLLAGLLFCMSIVGLYFVSRRRNN